MQDQRCPAEDQHENRHCALYRHGQEEDIELRCESADKSQAQFREEHGDYHRAAERHRQPAVRVTAQLESELAALPAEEQQDLREGLGLPPRILERFMQALRQLLQLDTFFTAGPSEARAWLIPNGATAHYAAGRVHTDFQQRFVRAEVTPWREFARSPQPQPELKGRGYRVRDGDVLRFRGG